MVFDVDYDPVMTDCNRSSTLCIAPGHREELTLAHGLATADVHQDTESFEELLHGSLVRCNYVLPLAACPFGIAGVRKEKMTQMFGLLDSC